MNTSEEPKKSMIKQKSKSKRNKHQKALLKVLTKCHFLSKKGKLKYGKGKPSSEWKKFVKIRETHFQSLQSSILDNCCHNTKTKLFPEDVERLSLAIEQKALLASMQSDMYLAAINIIISDILKATKQKQIHPHVLQLLQSCDGKCTSTSCTETLSKQTTGISMETNNAKPIPPCLPCSPENISVSHFESTPIVQLGEDSKPSSTFEEILRPPLQERLDMLVIPDLLENSEKCKDESKEPNTGPFTESAAVSSPDSKSGFQEFPQSSPLCEPSSTVTVPEDIDDAVDEMADLPDPEIENLLHILQDSDSDDDMQSRGLTPFVEREVASPPTTTHMHSRDIGVTNSLSHQKYNKRGATSKHLPQMWVADRYIFLYKLTVMLTRMSAQTYCRTRDKLQALFGEDSDEEQEESMDRVVFKNKCVSRIIPSVAHYLKPYYRQKRIIEGSLVFKHLVRRIAEHLIDDIEYPSDLDIQICVRKFFPNQRKYNTIIEAWTLPIV